MLSIASIFSLISNHWEWIAGLIAFLFPSTGIGVWLNRRTKAQTELKENELIAHAPPEKAKTIKESKAKKQKADFIMFLINGLFMIGLLIFINSLFSENIARAVFLKDLDWVKSLANIQICLNFAVLVVFATRVVSSVASFDALMNSLPIIKNFTKK